MHIIQMIWLEEVKKKGNSEGQNLGYKVKKLFWIFIIIINALAVSLSLSHSKNESTQNINPFQVDTYYTNTHTHSHSNLLFARSPTHHRKYVYVDHKSILEQNVVILFMIMVNTSTNNDIPTHNEKWLRRWWEWRCMMIGKTGDNDKDSNGSDDDLSIS